MYTLVRSQILFNISCGLRHSWLSSIDKQKIAQYKENFYFNLSTHTTLRECSVDLSVEGVIDKKILSKKEVKAKKVKLVLVKLSAIPKALIVRVSEAK